MARMLACVALALLVGPAAACINDIELPAHEREFRSQYRTPTSPPPSPASDAVDPPAHRLLAGTGAVLLAGAVALALAGGRRRE
jgi:hypothetical protein